MKYFVLINLTYNMKLKSFYIFIIFLNICDVCICQDDYTKGTLGNLTHFNADVFYSDESNQFKQSLPDQEFIIKEIKNNIPNLEYSTGIAKDGCILYLSYDIFKIRDGYYGSIKLECKRSATVVGTQYMQMFTVDSIINSFVSINISNSERLITFENIVKNLIKDFAIMYYKANVN